MATAINNFLGGGPTTNTNQSNQGTSTSAGLTTTSNTPNIPQWYSSFLGSLPGQMQQLSSSLTGNAGKPLYGPQQQAAFQGNLNQSQGASMQTLLSQLASQGALNSGRAAQTETGLQLGGQSQLANYLAQVPSLNAANSLQNNQLLTQLQGIMNNFQTPISAFGSTGTNSASNNVFQGGTSTGQGVTNANVFGGLADQGINQLLQQLATWING